jgi:hypothetical protein
MTAFTSCTTLENRRDMFYGYEKVNGPYTRMLKTGIPDTEAANVSGSGGSSGDFKSAL